MLFYLPVLQLFELNNNSVHTSGQAVLSPVSEMDLFGRDPDQKVPPSSVPAPGPRAEKSSGWKEGDRQEVGMGKKKRAGSGPAEPGTRVLSGACCQPASRAAVHSWLTTGGLGRLHPPCQSGHSVVLWVVLQT